jgi:hypothetical protein
MNEEMKILKETMIAIKDSLYALFVQGMKIEQL